MGVWCLIQPFMNFAEVFERVELTSHLHTKDHKLVRTGQAVEWLTKGQFGDHSRMTLLGLSQWQSHRKVRTPEIRSCFPKGDKYPDFLWEYYWYLLAHMFYNNQLGQTKVKRAWKSDLTCGQLGVTSAPGPVLKGGRPDWSSGSFLYLPPPCAQSENDQRVSQI